MSNQKPLVGILGGMGPQAGLDMAGKIIAMTRTECDQDHIPFILFSLPATVPDRTSFLLGKTDINPAYGIAAQFESMSALGITVAAMACNTAYADPIFNVVLELLRNKRISLRILHMVRETVAHIVDAYPKIERVGVLATHGTYQTRLYDQALEAAGLEAVLPTTSVRENDIYPALYGPNGIKACSGVITGQTRRRVGSAIRHLHDLGAEAVILACTELPMAVGKDRVDGTTIVDPARIIAAKLIREVCPEQQISNCVNHE